MKQIIQNIRSGKLCVDEVPAPVLRDGGILVRSRASLVSAGTERMLMKLAKKSLVGKARERPDLVRRVFAKLRRDGFSATFQAVQDRLDREVPLGYSVCGEVIEVGRGAEAFAMGQQVTCAGAGYANHAEINYLPRLLAVRVPEGVSDESAAYGTVGAIALQGIRNADVRVGETVVVLGLGLIGQLAVQLLRASGCRVIGIDPAADRVELARACGADLSLLIEKDRTDKEVSEFSRGRGADAILITAATSSNAPVEMAARLARDRARVVMVGVTGMEIPRKPYYEKELSFIVSRSYGPGRYDPQYEEHGHDYPPGYVRWTENRNIEAFLDLVAKGSVQPERLTTHRFPIAEAEAAFELILTNRQPFLGVILTYPESADGRAAQESTRISLRPPRTFKTRDKLGVSFVGAGNFARSVLLPILAKRADVQLRGVATATGVSARSTGAKFGFDFCASAEADILSDPDTDVVFIATRHSQHAEMVCHALAAGKAVFVEKPLAITLDQLRQVREALESTSGRLMVGFNRRFSPLGIELKRFFEGKGPLTVSYRCNAGPLPDDHWISDPAEGGRIIGEACHFFDFFAFLTDSLPETVYAAAPANIRGDDAVITVTYSDGSVCQLVYTSSGPASFGKERVEVFAAGCAGVLEDFKRLTLLGNSCRHKSRRPLRADKGHKSEVQACLNGLRSGTGTPIPGESIVTTSLLSLAAAGSLHSGSLIHVGAWQGETINEPK